MRSPTEACAESARVRSTATVPGRRCAREPERTPRSWTGVGSPETPWAVADWNQRSAPEPVTARTEVRVTAMPPSVERGSVTTWSASSPASCCWRVARSWLVCRKTRVEEKAMASTIGVIAEASRRAWVRELAAASRPAGPVARSGRPNTAAQARATSGPSRATASMKSMTTPREALAASSPVFPAARRAQTIPPTRAARPRGCGSSRVAGVRRRLRQGPVRAGCGRVGGRRPSRRAGRWRGRCRRR